MKKEHIIRAWRNADDFADLSADQRAALPANPAASIEVEDDILSSISGGCGGATSAICSPCPPLHCY